MVDQESLTLTFVTAHPAEAARTLERISAHDAAALFATIPARAGAPVLAAMLPSAAARILAVLDTETAISQLAVTGTQAAVSILRQIPELQRRKLVAGLPTTAAMVSRMLLHYPEDSIGAWVDPDILVLSADTTVAEAMERIANGSEPKVEQVFSVDREQRLVGAINVHELLRVPGTMLLSNIAQKPDALLIASATLGGALKRRGWHQSSSLPVMDRSGRLIGVLRRSALDRALARGQLPAHTRNGAPLSAMLARGYWNAFCALADSSVSLLPRAKPIVSDQA